MLKLIANGTSLDLDGRASLTLQGHNPAFDDSLAGRFFSFPFRLPASGKNLRALQHANRLDVARSTATATVPAAITLGALQIAGEITVLERTASTIEVSFSNTGRKFSEEAGKVSLREIMPTVSIPQTLQPQIVATPSVAGQLAVVINGKVYQSANTNIITALAEIVAAISVDFPGIAVGGTSLTLNPGTLDPFNVGFSPTGVWTINTFRPLAYARRLNFANWFADIFTNKPDSFRMPAIFNGLFFDINQNPAFQTGGYMLNFFHDNVVGENILQLEREWKYSFVPFPRVKYLFQKIAEATGVFAFAGEYSDSTFGRLLLYQSRSIDKAFYLEFPDVPAIGWLNAHQSSFDLNQMVPDLDGATFVKNILDGLGMYVVAENNTIYIRRKVKQLENQAIDWTDKVAPGESIQFPDDQGATLRFATDDTDGGGDFHNAGLQLQPLVVGEGEVEIETWFRPLLTFKTSAPVAGAFWEHCFLRKPGNSPEFATDADDKVGRIFFDLGTQVDSDGNLYWMSSHRRENYQDVPVAEYDLEWDGDHGLYKTFFEKWIELADAPTIKIPLRLEAQDIAELLRWENPIRYFRTPRGAVRVLVKSFEFRASVGLNKSETVVECLRL